MSIALDLTMNIYFTSCSLLTPQIEQPGSIDCAEFFWMAKESLSPLGQIQLRRLRSPIDMENARSFVQKGRFNPLGNWSESEVGSEKWFEHWPPSLKHYVKNANEASPTSFSTLLVDFFVRDAQVFGQKNFIGRYFQCELALKWILAQLRGDSHLPLLAKERDELQTAGLWSFVEECLLFVEIELPLAASQLRSIYFQYRANPLQLLKSTSQWRMNLIDELLAVDLFSADHLLGICAQKLIEADWQRMSRDEGVAALRKMRDEESSLSSFDVNV